MASNTSQQISNECAVCFRRFVKPKVLSCGHSFCLECLEAAHVSGCLGRPSLNCALCREVTAVPPSGSLADLPTNYELQSILEFSTEEVSEDGGISDLDQPFDVVLAQDNIVVVGNGYIASYTWDGKQRMIEKPVGLQPFAIAYNEESSKFFVTDKASNSVLVYDNGLKRVMQFGNDRLKEPRGIAISLERNLMMVLNKESGTITLFDLNGDYISDIRTGDLKDPWHIKCTQNRAIVSDAGSKMIKIYDLDKMFSMTHSIHTRVDGVDMHCRGLDVDTENNIYVALRAPGYRTQRECIVKYNLAGTQLGLHLDSPPPREGFKSYISDYPIFAHLDSIMEDTVCRPGKNEFRLNFVRGIRYHRRYDVPHLLIVDAGNKRVRNVQLLPDEPPEDIENAEEMA